MSFKTELDIQFSPSQWSKRTRGIQRCEEHIKCIENYSQIVKQTIPCELDIPYGPGKRELLDIYGTNLPEESPVFIHFHGGYWQIPSVRHDNNSYIAKNLHAHGIKSIFVGYELCPDVTISLLLENIQKALKMCLTLLIPSKIRGIYLSGHSAGAQIAAILFKDFIPNLPKEHQTLFKSAFLIAGVYDLLPLLETSYNDLLKLDEASAISASPLRQKLKATNCEMIVIVAEDDSPKLIEQGEKMYQHVKDLGFKSKFLLRKDTDHYDVIENLYDSQNELVKLIVDYCIKN